MRKLETMRPVSPSQLDKYYGCPRKWAWSYMFDIWPPKSPKMQFGLDVHQALEDWIKDATPPDEKNHAGVLARKAIPFVPAPSKRLTPEVKFNFEERGVRFTGVIDLPVPAGTKGPKGKPSKLVRPMIVDYKTTGSLTWAKTPEKLMHDPQAVMYAWWGIREWGGEEIDFRWIYMPTAGKPRAVPVDGFFNLTTLEKSFKGIVATAKEMQTLWVADPEPSQIQCNPSACEDYGGCFFQERCEKMKASTLKALTAMQEAQKQEINPPDSEDVFDTPDEIQHSSKKAKGKTKKKIEDLFSSPAQDPDLPAPVSPAGPKRKKKAAGKALLEGPEKKEDAPPEKKEAPQSAQAGPLILLLDCICRKGEHPATPLYELCKPLEKGIANQCGVEDWRLLEYGKKQAYLQIAFERWLDDTGWSGGIEINTWADEWKVLQNCLEERATLIFQKI